MLFRSQALCLALIKASVLPTGVFLRFDVLVEKEHILRYKTSCMSLHPGPRCRHIQSPSSVGVCTSAVWSQCPVPPHPAAPQGAPGGAAVAAGLMVGMLFPRESLRAHCPGSWKAVAHSSTRGLRPPEHLERQAGFPSSDKTRPDSPVPTLQGPCGRSPKRRGSLRCLPPLFHNYDALSEDH